MDIWTLWSVFWYITVALTVVGLSLLMISAFRYNSRHPAKLIGGRLFLLGFAGLMVNAAIFISTFFYIVFKHNPYQ